MCVCLKQLAELVQCDITEVIVDDHHSNFPHRSASEVLQKNLDIVLIGKVNVC